MAVIPAAGAVPWRRRQGQLERAPPVVEVLAELGRGGCEHRVRGVAPALGAAALEQLVVRRERDAGERLAVRGQEQVADRAGQHHPPQQRRGGLRHGVHCRRVKPRGSNTSPNPAGVSRASSARLRRRGGS